MKLEPQSSKTAKFAEGHKNLPPRRRKNSDVREREFLAENEIERIRKAIRRDTRNGFRNDVLIMLTFRHGLRNTEVRSLMWSQINLDQGFMYVGRLKNGIPSTHPLKGEEIRALRKLKRMNPDSSYVFVSERKAPLSMRAVHHIVAQAGKLAELPLPIHPHMLRHSTGFRLTNKGEELRRIQDYLGHANINNTVKYTRLNHNQFNSFWDD
jgi:type 1 fimbriae regulatory protein FimB/type 1 fimbriae regulatory protein FimE